jgi:hypothetical protein
MLMQACAVEELLTMSPVFGSKLTSVRKMNPVTFPAVVIIDSWIPTCRSLLIQLTS